MTSYLKKIESSLSGIFSGIFNYFYEHKVFTSSVQHLLRFCYHSFQNFSLTKEELGMTRVGDLSEQDMVKVRSLALIELTALFDTYGISMNRRKPLTKLKQKGMTH